MKKLFVLGIIGATLAGAACRPLGSGGSGGHVNLIFEVDTSKLSASQSSNIRRIRGIAMRVLEHRARSKFGVSTVSENDSRQIVVTLPGDAELAVAEREFGARGKLEFYWARTVISPLINFVPYEPAETLPGLEPSLRFRRRRGTGGIIAFWLPPSDPAHPENRSQNPEYQEIIRSWGQPVLEGGDFIGASTYLEGRDLLAELLFSKSGSAKIEKWSRSHPQANLAIVLDGKVLSLNPLAQGVILRDNALIHGHLDPAFVSALVREVDSGELPVDLKLVSASKLP